MALVEHTQERGIISNGRGFIAPQWDVRSYAGQPQHRHRARARTSPSDPDPTPFPHSAPRYHPWRLSLSLEHAPCMARASCHKATIVSQASHHTPGAPFLSELRVLLCNSSHRLQVAVHTAASHCSRSNKYRHGTRTSCTRSWLSCFSSTILLTCTNEARCCGWPWRLCAPSHAPACTRGTQRTWFMPADSSLSCLLPLMVPAVVCCDMLGVACGAQLLLSD